MNTLLERLKLSLEQRRERGSPVHLFFRDDDVDEDEPTLRRLLQLFLRQDTPINLGVIPGRLTAAGAAFLSGSVSAAPALIELNQHGWRHINHEREGRKCEFGPSRSYDEQYADIAKGRARMTESFGSNWFPVFIPPWNRCSEDAYRAVDQLGFAAFSAKQGNAVAPGYSFKEISITVDLIRWRGGVRLKPSEEIVDELIEQLSRPQSIGVMLHHKVMDESAFSLLSSLLDTFASDPIVRFHNFQSLARLKNEVPQIRV